MSWIRWADGPLAALPGHELRDGLDIRRLVLPAPARGLVRRARFFRRLTREASSAAAATAADAFVVHNAELLWAGLAAAAGRPVFYDAEEHFPAMVAEQHPLEARLFDLLERRAARKLAHVYVASEGYAARFRAIGVAVSVLYNSRPAAATQVDITREQARREAGIAEGDFVVGFVGSLSCDRGLELLLDALPLAPSDTRVVAYGGPASEVERFRALARRRGLEGRALFPGPIEEEELFRRLAAFDVGALLLPDRGPNYRFRAPYKLFDYMAAGIPVLATPLQEMRGIVEDAGCGVMVEPDAAAVAETLTRLARDRGLQEQMGERARTAFDSTYCWEHMVNRLRASHPFWR